MDNNAGPLTRTQCLARLATERVGRASVSRRALPVILPVTYECDGAQLLLRAPLDADFADVCDSSVLAFEVGHVDANAGGWSVQVVGIGSIMPDRSVRLDLERMTGRN